MGYQFRIKIQVSIITVLKISHPIFNHHISKEGKENQASFSIHIITVVNSKITLYITPLVPITIIPRRQEIMEAFPNQHIMTSNGKVEDKMITIIIIRVIIAS